MIVNLYEDGKFKVVMIQETKKLYGVYILDGPNSQRVYSKDMDYDTALEVYDFVVDNRSKNVVDNIIEDIKRDVK